MADTNTTRSAINYGTDTRFMSPEQQEAAKSTESVVLSSDFAKSVSTQRVAEVLGVDESLIIDDLNMTALGREQNVYTKSDLSKSLTVTTDSSGSRLDAVSEGVSKTIAGCTITQGKKGKYHCESDYLGSFDYDPSEFAVGYKTLSDGSKLPVFRYVGNKTGSWRLNLFGYDVLSTSAAFVDGERIVLPEGLEVGDYTFEGNDKLRFLPKLPDSLISGHYMFANCSNVQDYIDEAGTIGCDGSGMGMFDSYRFPSGIEDMSGMFKNDKKLDCAFGDVRNNGTDLRAEDENEWTTLKMGGGLPSSVLNLQDTWEGCDALGTDHSFFGLTFQSTLPLYGKDITPYLTSTYAKDALNVQDADAQKVADTAEFTVDEKGKIAEGVDVSNLDIDKLAQAQVATRLDMLENIHNAKVDNNAEIASDGARSNNYYYDASDGAIHDDVTGLMVSDDKTNKDWWQRYVIDGAIGLGISAVVGGSTKNKYIGLGAGILGAVGLDYFNLIPESLMPISRWIEDKLPEGTLKTKLQDFNNRFGETHIAEQQKQLTPEAVAATHQNRRLQRSVFGIEGSYELSDVKQSLYNNAKYCGANLNFKATADVAVAAGEDKATAGARAVLHESVGSLEQMWNEKADAGEDMTAFLKNMKEYYVELMEGLAEYNKGAKEGIVSLEKKCYRDASQQGLEMLNRAYTDEVLTSLKEMDSKYHFMDDAAWNKIAILNISGVNMTNVRNYDSSQMTILSQASINEVKRITAEAGDEYDVGEVVHFREGESYWNSGSGKFYNEELSNEAVAENREKAASEREIPDVGEESSADEPVDDMTK